MATTIPIWKIIMDRVIALIMLILCFPAFLLIAVAIKLGSPGPLIFKQVRVGHLRREFKIWKFRTMKVDVDTDTHQDHFRELMRSNTPMTKLDQKKDTRIIPFGKILRQTGLDELPQVFNVLKGEMSLIGPRPCLPYEVEKYLRWHSRRFDVLPGVERPLPK